MKKGIVLLTLLALVLSGCGEIKDEKYSDNGFFVTISDEFYGKVIYDKRTGVEYWYSCGHSNTGTLTMLVDKDGKPLIYDGYTKN